MLGKLAAPCRWVDRSVRELLSLDRKFDMLVRLVLLGEALLGFAVILKVAYTEIDWIAYMEEVGGFLSGELDYTKLGGHTGPLVYPAGFVYIFSVLYWVTGQGANVRLAQYLFLVLYLVFIAIVLAIYRRTGRFKNRTWVMLLVLPSYRIHSIFVLRLFNDCVAMIFLYWAVYKSLRNQWSWACFWYSVALSIKMNVLLFAPALGVLLLKRFGLFGAIRKLFICLFVQILVGFPFFLENVSGYLERSFQFGRAFFYKWTVNLKFLPEEAFLSKDLAIGLLVAHLLVLFYFLNLQEPTGIVRLFTDALRCRLPRRPLPAPAPAAAAVGDGNGEEGKRAVAAAGEGEAAAEGEQRELVELNAHLPGNLTNEQIVTSMFVSNFVGMVFARSLHYQFYVWYYHTIPYLLWLTPFWIPVRLVLLGLIEWCWNVYPARPMSSAVLWVCHFVILFGLALRLRRNKRAQLEQLAKAEADSRKTQ